jgi:hypothetical protein
LFGICHLLICLTSDSDQLQSLSLSFTHSLSAQAIGYLRQRHCKLNLTSRW